MIHFENDYGEGTYPEILTQLSLANFEQTSGYGTDPYCESAVQVILNACELDATAADLHFLPGGTLTNLTLISAALRPHQGVICAYTGHIATHEGGAIEATGHKVIPLPSRDGKLSAKQISSYIEQFYEDPTFEHQVLPAMVYLSDLTELGTTYTKKELLDITLVCRAKNLLLFLDGARLGYSLCASDSDKTLPDVASCCDAFTFGGTKIGLLFGEALILKNPILRPAFRTIMKQKGALMAKGRLLGIQFLTLFEKDLWRAGGLRAIKAAEQIRSAFAEAGYSFLSNTTGNQIFPILPDTLISVISKDYTFSIWEKIDDSHTAVRFCTSWATKESDVLSLIDLIRRGGKSTNIFDTRAATWDTERRKDRTKILIGELRQEIEGEPVQKALEFGCGTGLVGFGLLDLFGNLSLTDSSAEMIRIVNDKIGMLAPGRAEAIHADLTKGDKLLDQYDLIFSSMALHHVVDIESLLITFSQALFPQGRLALIDLLPVDEKFHSDDPDFDGHHGFDPEKLSADLQRIGFSQIHVRTIYHGSKPVGSSNVPYALFLMTARKDD